MAESSLDVVGSIIKRYQTLEQVCKEMGVTVAELERELPVETVSLAPFDLRSSVKRLINERNLRDAAIEANMPAAVYLALQCTFNNDASAVTSLREDRPLTKEEFKQRANVRNQMGLFDDTQDEDEEIGDPFG